MRRNRHRHVGCDKSSHVVLVRNGHRLVSRLTERDEVVEHGCSAEAVEAGIVEHDGKARRVVPRYMRRLREQKPGSVQAVTGGGRQVERTAFIWMRGQHRPVEPREAGDQGLLGKDNRLLLGRPPDRHQLVAGSFERGREVRASRAGRRYFGRTLPCDGSSSTASLPALVRPIDSCNRSARTRRSTAITAPAAAVIRMMRPATRSDEGLASTVRTARSVLETTFESAGRRWADSSVRPTQTRTGSATPPSSGWVARRPSGASASRTTISSRDDPARRSASRRSTSLGDGCRPSSTLWTSVMKSTSETSAKSTSRRDDDAHV